MKWRCNEDELMAQVKADTKEVWGRLGSSPTSIDLAPDMETFSHLLGKAYDLTDERLPSREEVKDSFQYCEGREDYLFITGWWTKRLLSGGRTLDGHIYKIGDATYCLSFDVSGGLLSVSLEKECWGSISKLLQIQGKPTRVLAQLLGEKLLTKAASLGSFKAKQMELHFLTHYIPEMYIKMSRDESLESCMSKHSGDYNLPSNLHPTMVYENSPNAVLCLLYDQSKGRHVARAVGLVEYGHVVIPSSYGIGGRERYFDDLGCLKENGLDGLKLGKVEYDGEYLAPYVDGDYQLFKVEEDYLLVSDDGHESSYETGRLKIGEECSCCGDTFPEDEMTSTADDGRVCGFCRDNTYIWVEGREAYYHESCTRYVEGRDESFHEDDVSYSEYMNEYVHGDDVITVSYSDGRRVWSDVVSEEALSGIIEDLLVVAIDGEAYTYEDEEDAA